MVRRRCNKEGGAGTPAQKTISTTFNVISLGNLPIIDPVEGNSVAENADALVGMSFGGPGNALVNNFQSFSPGSTGFDGGMAGAYDMNNELASETFRIDGGPDQTFDGVALYNATLTYVDGSTANIAAVVFQDTEGNTYLAPHITANGHQSALEAGAIRSLSLDNIVTDTAGGMAAQRQPWDFVTCFTDGTLITTPDGATPIEALRPGDSVVTQDHGTQPIRWIGAASCVALGRFRPVRIATGALGRGLPRRDLVVSQQHRMLISSHIARRVVGAQEVLVPAKKLIGLPGIDFARDRIAVTYYHLLLDHHEVIFAEDAPTESLMTGPMARQIMGAEAMAEIRVLFPELLLSASHPARIIPRGKEARELLTRHERNAQPLLQLR